MEIKTHKQKVQSTYITWHVFIFLISFSYQSIVDCLLLIIDTINNSHLCLAKTQHDIGSYKEFER